jgi:hypothetical protein
LSSLLGTSGSKGKEKEKKEATRQTTLFGMPGPANDKKARNKKKAVESQDPQGADSQQESQDMSTTQDTDVSMIDATQPSEGETLVETLVETQPDEWQWLPQSGDQPSNDSHSQPSDPPQEVADAVLQKEPSPEPIDWPPSPPAMNSTLSNNAAAVEVN